MMFIVLFTLLWRAPLLVAGQSVHASWQWATRATSTPALFDEYSEGQVVKVDGSGNVFCAGTFYGTTVLNGTTLPSADNHTSLLVKYTPTGQLAWIRQLVSTSIETIVMGLAVDRDGNSIVVGRYAGGNLNIGTTMLTGGGGFITKYDPQGTVLWAHGTGQSISELDCTATGEVVATGYFSGSVTFGNIILTTALNVGHFLVKYNAQGGVLWASKFEGAGHSNPHISLDANDNAYISGHFERTMTFGTITLPQTSNKTTVFVAKYSAAGTPQWARQQPAAFSSTHEFVNGMATDASGNTYLTVASSGPSSTEYFITQYTSDGAIGWSHSTSSLSRRGTLLGVATDAAGNVYIVGSFRGSLQLGGLSLTTSSSTDHDLALYSFSPSGAPRWALTAGTATGTEYGVGVDVDNFNNVYLTGSLYESTALGPLLLPYNNLSLELFVAKASMSVVTSSNAARSTAPLSVYPNPAKGASVKVAWGKQAKGPARLHVRDAVGRVVGNYAFTAGQSEAALPVQQLRPGVYTLHLTTASATEIGKLVVE